jgi:hypothetical protein
VVESCDGYTSIIFSIARFKQQTKDDALTYLRATIPVFASLRHVLFNIFLIFCLSRDRKKYIKTELFASNFSNGTVVPSCPMHSLITMRKWINYLCRDKHLLYLLLYLLMHARSYLNLSLVDLSFGGFIVFLLWCTFQHMFIVCLLCMHR